MRVKIFSFKDELVEKRAAGEMICVRCGKESKEDRVCDKCCGKIKYPSTLVEEATIAVLRARNELVKETFERSGVKVDELLPTDVQPSDKENSHKFYVDFRTGEIFLSDGRVVIVDLAIIRAWETTDRIDECPVTKIAGEAKTPHGKDEGHPEYSACSACKNEGGFELVRGVKMISRNIQERAVFNEAVCVVVGLLKEGKNEDEARQELAFLYPEKGKEGESMPDRIREKAFEKGKRKFRRGRQAEKDAKWKAAEAAVEAYYADNPADLAKPPFVASRIFADPAVAAATTHGMLTAAVAKKQEDPAVKAAADEAKACAFANCEAAVAKWYEEHPDERRHPAKVADDISTEYEAEGADGTAVCLSVKMLTKAAFNHQDKVRKAERERLSAGGNGPSGPRRHHRDDGTGDRQSEKKDWRKYAPKSSGLGTLADTVK